MSFQVLEIGLFSPNGVIIPLAHNSSILLICVTNSIFIESSHVYSILVCVQMITSLKSGMFLLMGFDMMPTGQQRP